MTSPALRLPRHARLVLGGDALSAVGTGLTLPFLVVYLHQVRGLGLGLSGLVLSTVAIAGLAGNPLGGWLSDRYGARNALLGGLVVATAGALAMARAAGPADAFGAAGLVGLGAATIWPAQDALLATVVSQGQRSSVFSIRHATLNAGLGIGSLASALIVDAARPASFQLMYLLDAASFVAFIPILLCIRSPERRPAGRGSRAARRGDYREVLRDRAFRRVWALTALLICAGYAQIHAALPAFATRPGGISPVALGLGFAANAITVVVAQLVVLKLLAGVRRTRAIMALGVLWATAWVITLVAGAMGGGLGASIAFALALVVFGLGETFLAPSLTPIVNDLAPDHLRGHYNGALTLAWTSGFIIGPVVAGAALRSGQGHLLFGMLMLACVAAGAAARRLERHLPATTNRVGSGPITEPAGDPHERPWLDHAAA